MLQHAYQTVHIQQHWNTANLVCSPVHKKARWEGSYLTRYTRDNLFLKPFLGNVPRRRNCTFQSFIPKAITKTMAKQFCMFPVSDRQAELCEQRLLSNFTSGALSPHFISRWCLNYGPTFTSPGGANQLIFAYYYKISNLKSVSSVGMGNSCSMAHSIHSFSAKILWKERQTFDSRPKLVKLKIQYFDVILTQKV